MLSTSSRSLLCLLLGRRSECPSTMKETKSNYINTFGYRTMWAYLLASFLFHLWESLCTDYDFILLHLLTANNSLSQPTKV